MDRLEEQFNTEKKLAEERILLLQTSTMDVAAAADVLSALKVVLRRVCEKTGWALGQAWIPRQDGAGLDCCPVWFAARPGPSLKAFRTLSSEIILAPGQGLPGRVHASKRPAWIRDVTQDANFPRAAAAREAGLKAALAVPILSGHDVIAVPRVFPQRAREEDEVRRPRRPAAPRQTHRRGHPAFRAGAPDRNPVVRGSARRLEQVVINLVLNACQALRNHQESIRLTTGFDGQRVFIRVRDEGRGIAPEHLADIRTPFFTTKRTEGGTGLGVPVSDRIANEHGGELTFESAPGRGTTATLWLPAGRRG